MCVVFESIGDLRLDFLVTFVSNLGTGFLDLNEEALAEDDEEEVCQNCKIRP